MCYIIGNSKRNFTDGIKVIDFKLRRLSQITEWAQVSLEEWKRKAEMFIKEKKRRKIKRDPKCERDSTHHCWL